MNMMKEASKKASKEGGSLIEVSVLELEKEVCVLEDHIYNLLDKVKPFVNSSKIEPNKELSEVKEPSEKSSFRQKISDIQHRILRNQKDISTILDTLEI